MITNSKISPIVSVIEPNSDEDWSRVGENEWPSGGVLNLHHEGQTTPIRLDR